MGITRNVWDSDKRVEHNFWPEESVCDYCLIKKCEYCFYGRKKSPIYSERTY